MHIWPVHGNQLLPAQLSADLGGTGCQLSPAAAAADKAGAVAAVGALWE